MQRSQIAEVPFAALTNRLLFLDSVHKLQTRKEGGYIYAVGFKWSSQIENIENITTEHQLWLFQIGVASAVTPSDLSLSRKDLKLDKKQKRMTVICQIFSCF